MKLIDICNNTIKIGFYLLFGLVPLLLTPWNYELFEFNKMVAVYALTLIIGASWITKMLAQKEIKIARTPLDIPLFLFFTSQLIATIFSIDQHISWFGYYSRFNGGMWSMTAYVLLFYAFISNLEELAGDKQEVKRQDSKNLTFSLFHLSLLKVTLTSAAVVAIYGVLERFGIDKHLWVQDVQNRVFSTLGQPNWLAAYLIALIPITMAMYIKTIDDRKLKIEVEDRKSKIYRSNLLSIIYSLPPFSTFYLLLSILFFITLLFTRSRSGLIGFAVADIIFWGILYLVKSEKQEAKSLKFQLFLFHFSLFAIMFIIGTSIPQFDKYFSFQGWQSRLAFTNSISQSIASPSSTINIPSSKYTAPLLESGGTESSKIRKYVWEGAINAWKATPKNMLIGTGTETFAWAFFQHRPAEHNLTSEWDFLYNKAHNEYLNFLATTGIFGLGAYLLLIGTFIFWGLKFLIPNFPFEKTQDKQFSVKISNFKFQIGEKNKINDGFAIILALFSGWISLLVTNFFGFSVVTQQLFFFLFPAMIISVSSVEYQSIKLKQLESKNSLLRFFTFALLALLSFTLFYSLINYWRGDALFASGYRLNRANLYAQAQSKLENAISHNSGEPLYHDELAQAFTGLAISAIESNDASKAAEFAKLSFAQNDKALTISPNNVNFWKTRTKIFYAFADLDEGFLAAAVQALERARQLSPNDPKIYYNLAILNGKQGKNEEAIKLLQKSIELKPNYRDAFYALYVFYVDAKNPTAGKDILSKYLNTVDPNDQEFQTFLK